MIGDATLYLGDCLKILPTLEKVDAVITDPPYGIGYVASVPKAIVHRMMTGDLGGVDLRKWLEYEGVVISWGANNYPEQLPHRGRWLCWDKRAGRLAADKMLGSSFELAWMNATTGYDKMFRLLHGGVVNADGATNADGIRARREHPTQKPVALMEWCIQVAKMPKVVLDPFMGSGTTGVASVNLGSKFIGVEIEPKYFEIACRRIHRAVFSPPLFSLTEEEKRGCNVNQRAAKKPHIKSP